MWNKIELVKLFIERENRMLKMLMDFERKASAPEPKWDYDPPTPRKIKSKYTPGTQKWFATLPKPRDDPDAVTMNQLARFIPKRRPPLRPGSQSRRWNGSWFYWS